MHGMYGSCMRTTDVPGVGPALRDRVAEEVRALMGRRRVTGAELARAINVPQASLQRRLSGRYPFDVDLLEQIATYFRVPVVTLFPSPEAAQGITLKSSRPSGDRPVRIGQAA
jgi:transcriptional regulator with XRE-family HTH domain